MPLRLIAARNEAQNVVSSQCRPLWISDNLLRHSFDRFARRVPSPNCLRYGSNVPGPLEARRRLDKRRLNQTSILREPALAPSADPLDFSWIPRLWGRIEQPLWKYEPPDFKQAQIDQPPVDALDDAENEGESILPQIPKSLTSISNANTENVASPSVDVFTSEMPAKDLPLDVSDYGSAKLAELLRNAELAGDERGKLYTEVLFYLGHSPYNDNSAELICRFLKLAEPFHKQYWHKQYSRCLAKCAEKLIIHHITNNGHSPATSSLTTLLHFLQNRRLDSFIYDTTLHFKRLRNSISHPDLITAWLGIVQNSFNGPRPSIWHSIYRVLAPDLRPAELENHFRNLDPQRACIDLCTHWLMPGNSMETKRSVVADLNNCDVWQATDEDLKPYAPFLRLFISMERRGLPTRKAIYLTLELLQQILPFRIFSWYAHTLRHVFLKQLPYDLLARGVIEASSPRAAIRMALLHKRLHISRFPLLVNKVMQETWLQPTQVHQLILRKNPTALSREPSTLPGNGCTMTEERIAFLHVIALNIASSNKLRASDAIHALQNLVRLLKRARAPILPRLTKALVLTMLRFKTQERCVPFQLLASILRIVNNSEGATTAMTLDSILQSRSHEFELALMTDMEEDLRTFRLASYPDAQPKDEDPQGYQSYINAVDWRAERRLSTLDLSNVPMKSYTVAPEGKIYHVSAMQQLKAEQELK